MQPAASPSKKRAPRFVASRYKEAAKKKAADASHIRHGSIDRSSERSITPYRPRSGSLKRNEVTSTPATSMMNVPIWDASAIVPGSDDSYIPSLPVAAGGARPKIFKNEGARKGRTANPVIALPLDELVSNADCKKDADDDDVPLQEEDLDILYAQYIQAVYLESKALSTLEEKASDAMKQLSHLWANNMLLMKKQNYVEKELSTVQYVQQLYPLCEEMKNILLPLHECLSKLIPNYEEIAEGVSTINNKLEAPDISYSRDEEFQRELAEAIQKMKLFTENFINENTVLSSEVEAMARLSKMLNEVNENVKSYQEMVQQVEALMINKCSLDVANIQLS